MGGATNRFFTLLSSNSAAPIPLLLHHHRRYPCLLRRSRRPKLPLLPSSFSSLSHRRNYLTIYPSSPSSSFVRKASQHFHSHAGTSSHGETHFSDSASAAVSPSVSASWTSHPWPEWSNLVNSLSAAGYFNRNLGFVGNDEFVGIEGLPEDFTLARRACLAFAQERASLVRLLSRRDVEVVVENGTPFLFKDADGSATRLRSFLSNSQTNIEEKDGWRMSERLLADFLDEYIYIEKDLTENSDSLCDSSKEATAISDFCKCFL